MTLTSAVVDGTQRSSSCSTRSRGTGLGLYICKELCERYGATIEYRPGSPQDSHPNVFRVEMKRSPLALTESTLLS